MIYFSFFSVSFFQSLQKNGQISSMTSLNGHSEDNTLAEGVYVRLCVFCPGGSVYLLCVTLGAAVSLVNVVKW